MKGRYEKEVGTERERIGARLQAVRNFRREVDIFSRPPTRFFRKWGKGGELEKEMNGSGLSMI